MLVCAWLVTGSLGAASACSRFGTDPPSEAGSSDASDAASVDGTTSALDGSVPSDGSLGVDAAAACPAGAVCYDFEGNTDDVAITGDCAIADTVAHRGVHSAHCKGSTSSYFAITRSFAPTGPLAFRAFLRGIPPSNAQAPSVGYVGWIDPTLNIPRMMVGDANARHYDLWWTSAVGSGWISSTVVDGSPSWTCVEAVFALPNNLTYFVNGTKADFTRVDAQLGSAPLSFRWGLPYMQSSDVHEAYVDDIAIGTTRIGCE